MSNCEGLQKQAQALLEEKENALREAAEVAEFDKEAALDDLQKACDDELDRMTKKMEVRFYVV